MVKLVTSRVHRCYSALGNSRSIKHERLNDIAYLLAVSLLLGDCALAHPRIALFFKFDRHKCALLGSSLLFLTQLLDLFAVYTAHRMHFQTPRHSSKNRPFSDTTTKVDAFITMCYLVGTTAYLGAAKISLNKGGRSSALMNNMATLSGAAFMFGALSNSILALPALVVKVPAPVARAHNAVVGLFLAGSTANLIVVLGRNIDVAQSDSNRELFAVGFMASFSLMWVGGVLNLGRVGALQSRPRARNSFTSDDESWKRGGNTNRSGGILSWFKSSKSDQGVDSEYDSEEIDEEDGSSSEEEEYSRRKSRR